MKVRGEVGGIVRSEEMAELAEVGSRVISEVSKGESSIRIESEGRKSETRRKVSKLRRLTN